MTSPKQLKYWRKNVKNIILELIGFYLQFLLHLKICMFSKMFIFDFKNVHAILDFLTRRGKFISYFSEFYLFFYAFSSRNFFKKKTRARAPTGPKAQPTARLAGFLFPHGRRSPAEPRRRRRLGCPSPKPPSPAPLHIYPAPLRFRRHHPRRSRRRRRI